MKLATRFLATLALTAAAALPIHAQTLKVATGPAKGTYSTMFKELNNECANEVPMIEVVTSGSNDNISALTGNQVNAVFTQTDVLYFRARTEELGNVKTLMTLHPEEVHLVALAHSPITTGGYAGTGIGAKPVVFNDITSLANYKVGAAGGSFTTAQVIRLQSEIPFTVEQYGSNDELLAALKEGKIQAALMVGGSPLPVVAGLGPDYKLLPIPESVAAKMKGVYRPARLNYNRMNAAGVPTVATDAIFVTREYKTPKMIQALAKFRACAFEKIDELKETTGTHPKWQAVDVNNKGRWAWYDLPAVQPAAAATNSVANAPALQPVADAAPAKATTPATPAKKK